MSPGKAVTPTITCGDFSIRQAGGEDPDISVGLGDASLQNLLTVDA
jgi:hypothetical protein